ncbi:unnamed protein product [Psylliodes chrysocephalus]|uniref:Uncharacterized protein n=1 Tax=Psylliodes chrysocephalus TaxID=3402493 RepID=A0A9P0CFM7_9CUCU|nr:unnamed protein product [Psylliodes chrysocephala]
MSCKTRSKIECPIFRARKCISENVLPTYEDMNRYFNCVEYELKPLSTNPQQTATEATKVVVKKIWDKASISTVLQCTIIKRITSYRLKIRNLLKPYKQRNKVISRSSFLLDQRTVRKMLISSLDVKTTKINQKRIERNKLLNTKSELDENEKSGLQVKKDTQRVERSQQESSTSQQVFTVPQGCLQIQLEFNIIESNIPALDESVSTDLSTDQKYLYDICDAISKGTVDENLSTRSPGKILHSRWLTTANRILRLYVSTAEPSENLSTLGAFNVWEMISLSRHLPKRLKEVIDPVILRNSYFAHPENILLGMLGDTREHIQKFAVLRIFKTRNSNKQQSRRKFEDPNSLNMSASSYMDLIDWSTSVITEPPLTMELPEEVLNDILKNPASSMLFSEIKSYLCHMQDGGTGC